MPLPRLWQLVYVVKTALPEIFFEHYVEKSQKIMDYAKLYPFPQLKSYFKQNQIHIWA